MTVLAVEGLKVRCAEPSLKRLKEDGASYDLVMPSYSELAEIVRAPAEMAGLEFERDSASGLTLDQLLLHDALDRPDPLPLLQFTLSHLFKAAQSKNSTILSSGDYRALGGLEGAIDNAAEVAIQGLGAAGRARVPRLLRVLTTPTIADRPAVAGAALNIRPAPLPVIADDETSAQLVRALVNAGILLCSREGKEDTVRLAHVRVLDSHWVKEFMGLADFSGGEWAHAQAEPAVQRNVHHPASPKRHHAAARNAAEPRRLEDEERKRAAAQAEAAAKADDSTSLSPKLDAFPAPALPPAAAPRPGPALSMRSREAVEFAVSNPAQVAVGVPFLVDAWAFRPEDRLVAVDRTREVLGADAAFRSSASAMVSRGAKLKVELLAPPWPVDPKWQTITWAGNVTCVSFRVRPDAEAPGGKINAVCRISLHGLRVGEIHFDIPTGRLQGKRRLSDAKKRLAAFASYASKDRSRVLARVQGIEKFADVFTDVRNLAAGEAYPHACWRG